VLLGLLKKITNLRNRLKIIIMSATIGFLLLFFKKFLELEKFSQYFNTKSTYFIEGRCFPIGIYYA